MLPTTAAPKIFTVTELNTMVHDLVESSFPELWIEGEISNCRAYPSGHTYLSLKDEGSQIQAVLFKGAASAVRFQPKDGIKVLVRARLSTYVKRGDMQLVISAMEPREKGALQLAFEQLKAKLALEGLFDEDRKKPLPAFAQRIGIITSLQGAAVRDILNVLERRWPGLEVLIYPVRVQGDEAKSEISQAIADFNEYFSHFDILLVGRGGGSLEDLWAFNEEVVARAIAASVIPIISCVGHETDTTIADFVADCRAPTPSAAAELAVPEKQSVIESIASLCKDAQNTMEQLLENLSQRLNYLKSHPFLLSPHRLYEERMRRVDEVTARLPLAVRAALTSAMSALKLQAEKLEAFSPLNVLARGYAIAEEFPSKNIIRSSKQVKPGQKISLRVHEGNILCEVIHEQNEIRKL